MKAAGFMGSLQLSRKRSSIRWVFHLQCNQSLDRKSTTLLYDVIIGVIDQAAYHVGDGLPSLLD
jgi:hypothetical protein